MNGIVGALIVFGVLLIGLPIGLKVTDVEVGGAAFAIMLVAGIVSMFIAAVLAVITKLYVKTKADEAFVRTGMGGMKIIKDGGAVVVPVVHQCVKVPLRTFRLEVSRKGADALLTQDKLRAEIKAEFFVRIQAENEDITNAARSLGDRTGHEETIKALIEDKLVSALRTIAATKTLEQLNSERDDFVKAVMESVKTDLKHNGFTLETATISQLDQADASTLRKDNVFDAEGLATIARITQEKQTEANGITQQQEQERFQQNVQAKQRMYALEQQQAQAQAEQQAQIVSIKAQQDQVAQQAQIEADRKVKEAALARQQALEVRGQEAERAKLVAEQQKQQALAVAEQERDQAAQVAAQERSIAVAAKQQQLAEAEQKRLEAEKKRETEAQAIETVKVKAAAERDKEQRVIAAEADAQEKYVAAERSADAEAYQLRTLADGKRAAADADAEAIKKKADAEAEAAKKRAEGQKAEQLVGVEVSAKEAEVQRQKAMIPVDVAAAQVAVDKQRVEEVLKPELAARDEHGKVAQEFELAKLQIDAEAQVRIAMANAAATFGSKVQATLFGTPEDVQRMSAGLVSGMAGAQFAQGLFGGNGNGNGHVKSALETLTGAVGALVSKFQEHQTVADGAPAAPAPDLSTSSEKKAARVKGPEAATPAGGNASA